MPCGPVDGMDPVAVAKGLDKAIKHARAGKGPSFLEMKTYRYRGHSMSDAQKYRTKKEVEEYRKIDPITQVKEIILITNTQQKNSWMRLTLKLRQQLQIVKSLPNHLLSQKNL